MAEAKYVIMIPTTDNQGNKLVDLATAAHHWLFYGPLKVQGSYIDPGKKGNWRDNPQEIMDHLVTFAEDAPEMDSHIKQLAVHVAQVANQWGIFVTKESKQGPQSWVIDNPGFVDGQGADQSSIQREEPALGGF